MFCIENFNTPLSDREQKSALETWIKLIQPGEPMKSVGCEWTDDGKYQPRGKERGWYEDQGEDQSPGSELRRVREEEGEKLCKQVQL